ncbi:MAG: hypothetical protein KGZ37_00875 [Nitrosarchaeum sp.]|nr:hypothetical protein [Nitrosarchaeum sp.]
MRLVWLVIPLILVGVFGVQESFAENIFCKYASVPFNSEYEIVNGQVNALCLDKNALAIEIFIIPDGEGILTLTIPRNSIDIRNQDCTDKEFIITGDKQNLKFNELNATHDLRKLEIFFSEQELNEYFVITTDVMTGKPYKLGYDCLEKSEEQSLKKQIINGISSNDVICRDGLELIFKSSNGSPACVKPNSKIKLIEYGWTKSP